MALSYPSTLRPTKAELIAAWVPSRLWGAGPDPEVLGSFRFDDPDGQVGIETHLVAAGPTTMQVPLTYRGAPCAGLEDALVVTMEHSVLGRRWIYDGTRDPVYAAALARAILTGGREADVWIVGGGGERRDPGGRARGSGAPVAPVPAITEVRAADGPAATVITGGGLELVVRRRLDADPATTGAPTLRGTWPGRDVPTELARVRR